MRTLARARRHGSTPAVQGAPWRSSIQRHETETVTVNGRTLTRAWDASTRTLTETSAAGRVTTTVLDTEGRPVQQQVGTLTPTQFSYDANGRMSGLARGSRVTTMTYDSDSFVDSVTDPANRTVSFEYDDAGRVTEQELPDLRVIGFEYDANGNLTSLTPPGRPALWAVKPIENVLVWTTVSLPTGLSVKQILPEVAFGGECEGMGVGRALGHFFTS